MFFTISFLLYIISHYSHRCGVHGPQRQPHSFVNVTPALAASLALGPSKTNHRQHQPDEEREMTRHHIYHLLCCIAKFVCNEIKRSIIKNTLNAHPSTFENTKLEFSGNSVHTNSMQVQIICCL